MNVVTTLGQISNVIGYTFVIRLILLMIYDIVTALRS